MPPGPLPRGNASSRRSRWETAGSWRAPASTGRCARSTERAALAWLAGERRGAERATLRDGALEPDVPRGAADHDAIAPRRHRPTISRRVPVGEGAGVEHELHARALAGREVDLCEALERLRRLRSGRRHARQAEVELGHVG